MLSTRVLKTEVINWKKMKFLQQENFKELPIEAKQKLYNSILANQFTQPFYVWEESSTGDICCLDGRHRVIALEELIVAGYEVPELLPATFINCEDRRDAAKMVLIYSSIYANVTDKGLFDFIQLYDLKAEELSQTISLPDLDWGQFIADDGKDFSVHNSELDISAFGDQMTLGFTYTKEIYLEVRGKLRDLKEQYSCDENTVLLKLLNIESAV
jgi:hypothetical protein